jgi:imidazolonepropionase-like amidohydrolase
MLVAGNYVSSTGGAGDARQFSIFVDVPIVRNLADGPDEIVKAVRTNFKNGADFIKILVTGAGHLEGHRARAAAVLGRGDPGRRRRGEALGPRRGGARPRHRGIKAALRAGVRTIDHGSLLDASDRAAEGRPRLLRADHVRHPDGPSNPIVPEAEKERSRRIDAMAIESFKQALRAGLRIGLGSDAPVMPHGQYAKELVFRVGLGEAPMAAIVSRHARERGDPGLVRQTRAPSRRASGPTSSRCRPTRSRTSRRSSASAS